MWKQTHSSVSTCRYVSNADSAYTRYWLLLKVQSDVIGTTLVGTLMDRSQLQTAMAGWFVTVALSYCVFIGLLSCCYSSLDLFTTIAKSSSGAWPPPFPQIDIIRAVVIVWRVRGKTIRSVLCNIVCNNCAQCDAHTYEQTNSSLDWVLSHWAHFTVLDLFLYCVLLCVVCMIA